MISGLIFKHFGRVSHLIGRCPLGEISHSLITHYCDGIRSQFGIPMPFNACR